MTDTNAQLQEIIEIIFNNKSNINSNDYLLLNNKLMTVYNTVNVSSESSASSDPDEVERIIHSGGRLSYINILEAFCESYENTISCLEDKNEKLKKEIKNLKKKAREQKKKDNKKEKKEDKKENKPKKVKCMLCMKEVSHYYLKTHQSKNICINNRV